MYRSAEQTAITPASRTWCSTDSASRTAGAISEASMIRVSRTTELGARWRATGWVSSAMPGCSAAAPQAA